jgi:peptide/nickel transport system ATP-binding protein
MMRLELEDLHVRVGVGANALRAVAGVDLEVPAGSVVGLVGESGSGKSTLGRAIVGLAPPLRGRVLLDHVDYAGARGRRMRDLRRRVQLVFQDPRASLNPRMTVGAALAEAVRQRGGTSARGRAAEVARLLEDVHLDPAHARSRPAALSGGERQRVALARALAVEPELIIADEVTSSLDASVQATVLNLLRELRERTGISMLVISHDLAIVRYLADSTAVMHLGRVVEAGPTDELLRRPEHPYTRMLVESALLEGFADDAPTAADPPDPLHPPSGCRFRTQCPVGPLVNPQRKRCSVEDPRQAAPGRVHRAACHYASEAHLAG